MILINDNNKLIKEVPSITKYKRIGLDIEGTGLDPYTSHILLVQISTPDEIFVINVGRVNNETLRYLFRLIKDGDIQVIGHNLKYDTKMIYHHYHVLLTNLFDTMLAESFQMLGVGKKYPSYANLVADYFSTRLSKDIRMEFIGKEDYNFTEEQLIYAADDVRFLLPLHDKLNEKLKMKQSSKVWELEMMLEPAVTVMEYNGVLLDVNRWIGLAGDSERLANDYYERIERYLAERFDYYAGKYDNAYDAAKNICIPISRKYQMEALSEVRVKDEIISTLVPMINLNSPKQALTVLQGLGIPTDSSSQKELQKYADHEFIQLLFKYREYYKAGHAFGEEFLEKINPVTGRIHGNFDQNGAATGRFASSDPNLQNIKSEADYRACFRARDGYKFFTADYSQIELRILAQVSREPLMIEAFQNGEDLHKLTASIIFDKPMDAVKSSERGRAKNINFAVVYGTSEYGLRYNFGWPLETGRAYLQKYFDKYTTLKSFIDAVGTQVIMKKYSTTQYGRRRYFTLPQKLTRYHMKLISKTKRQGVNHLVQGGSADMIKLYLNNLFYDNPFDADYEFPENFRTLITVHDEGDGEFREDLEDDAREFIGQCMEKASKPFLTDVPVDYHIKIDDYWRK